MSNAIDLEKTPAAKRSRAKAKGESPKRSFGSASRSDG